MEYILGAWCAVMCFISPVWLTMIYLDLSGLVYRYDFSMDEGIAGIIGAFSLMVWILLAFVPAVLFGKKMYLAGRKHFLTALGMAAALVMACLIMCRFDVVAFLTTPYLR